MIVELWEGFYTDRRGLMGIVDICLKLNGGTEIKWNGMETQALIKTVFTLKNNWSVPSIQVVYDLSGVFQESPEYIKKDTSNIYILAKNVKSRQDV